MKRKLAMLQGTTKNACHSAEIHKNIGQTTSTLGMFGNVTTKTAVYDMSLVQLNVTIVRNVLTVCINKTDEYFMLYIRISMCWIFKHIFYYCYLVPYLKCSFSLLLCCAVRDPVYRHSLSSVFHWKERNTQIMGRKKMFTDISSSRLGSMMAYKSVYDKEK